MSLKSKFISMAAVAAFGGSSAFAATVVLDGSDPQGITSIGGDGAIEITSDATLNSGDVYILPDLVYVTAGATLTIEPGTLVRGEPQSASGACDGGALIVQRGGQLIAAGDPDGDGNIEPIIMTTAATDENGDGYADVVDPGPDGLDFTADDVDQNLAQVTSADPATATYLDSDPVNNPLDEAPAFNVDLTVVNRDGDLEGVEPGEENRGLWGGLILLGFAPNNVDLSASPGLEVGENFVEGLPDPTAGGTDRGIYGGNNPNDNSGVVRYVSIRHGGTNLAADNEINGLTMGSVGFGTLIEFVEVYCNLDDGYEWFGGTANTRYLASHVNNDDGFDIDEGFTGLGQFWFNLSSDDGANGEHGGEHDGGTSPQDGRPLTFPTVYNATYIGGGENGVDDNGGFQLRDNFGGAYFNSIFTEFRNEAVEIEDDGDTPGRYDAGELIFRENTWWNFGYLGTSTPTNTSAAYASGWAGSATTPDGTEDIWTNSALDNAIADPGLLSIVRRTTTGGINPRPTVNTNTFVGDFGGTFLGEPYTATFFTPVGFKGAFTTNVGQDLWTTGWTALNTRGVLAD